MNITGTCRILHCFDLGIGIDLALAEERITTWRRASFQHKSRVLTGEAVLPPLRVSFDTSAQFPASTIGAHPIDVVVELALYDLGAVSVTWSIPLDHPLEELVELSCALYGGADLKARSRKLAENLVESLGSAVSRPRVSELLEDYVVYELKPHDQNADELRAEDAGTIARILRAERDELSHQERDEALSAIVSYRLHEVCYVDWLSAILVGNDTEDERLVLELATVELLELRLLDSQLDQEIHEAYRILERPRRLFDGLTVQRHELHRVGRMQAEGAVLHEGIDNALKLLGDDYLARLYGTAAERLHFNDWDASIERKLGFLRNVYENLADLTSHRRSEILEWIIIILIAVDIVLYFTPFRH